MAKFETIAIGCQSEQQRERVSNLLNLMLRKATDANRGAVEICLALIEKGSESLEKESQALRLWDKVCLCAMNDAQYEATVSHLSK
jgi:hypothetical protein